MTKTDPAKNKLVDLALDGPIAACCGWVSPGPQLQNDPRYVLQIENTVFWLSPEQLLQIKRSIDFGMQGNPPLQNMIDWVIESWDAVESYLYDVPEDENEAHCLETRFHEAFEQWDGLVRLEDCEVVIDDDICEIVGVPKGATYQEVVSRIDTVIDICRRRRIVS